MLFGLGQVEYDDNDVGKTRKSLENVENANKY